MSYGVHDSIIALSYTVPFFGYPSFHDGCAVNCVLCIVMLCSTSVYHVMVPQCDVIQVCRGFKKLLIVPTGFLTLIVDDISL